VLKFSVGESDRTYPQLLLHENRKGTMLDATSELQHAYRRSRKVAKSNDLMVDFGKTENRLVAEVPFFVHLLVDTIQLL
jgi:hypothetical protein